MKQIDRNPYRMFYMLFMLALLTACASTALWNSEDYLQSAKAQVGASYRTIGDLKAQGQITKEEGDRYFARVEVQEKRVAAYETVFRSGGDISTVQGGLDLALAGLLELQSELNKRKPK